MEVNMSPEEVMQQIKKMRGNGVNMSKKKVKKSHPELMRSALHYFPDWDSAIDKSIG
ncbi:hypothetical protein LCL95_01065 [Bacillus timonensis]|nr:hypothetical protein [Bacillus timonensis]